MPIIGRLPNPGTITGVFQSAYGSNPYVGEYTIVPSAHESQRLNTHDKYMKQDVIVTIIPTYETSNDCGTTFIIGD